MIKDMTKGSPIKLITLFAMPMLLGNIFQQFYNLADTAIVGNYVGVNALAAVGATGSLNFMIIGFATGVATGFSVVLSKRFGANDIKGVKKAYAMSVVISFIISVLLTVFSLVFMRPVLTLMGTPQNIMGDALDYLNIIFGGLTATVFYNVLSGVMRALGDSKTPLIFLIVSSVINIVLDILFVNTFKLGIEGAALATIISQIISVLLCLWYIKYYLDILKVSKDDFKICFKTIVEILKIGLPMGFQMMITAIGAMAIQSTVNALDTPAIAAYTIGSKVEQLATLPALSFGLSMLSYTGQNLGAQKLSRIRKGLRQCIAVSTITCISIGALLCIFGREISKFFISDEDPAIIGQVLDGSHRYIIICSAFVWTLGLLYIYRNTLQGLGNSLISFISGLAELAVRIIVAILLSEPFGFAGICFSNPIAWAAGAAPMIAAYYVIIKRLERKAEGKPLKAEELS